METIKGWVFIIRSQKQRDFIDFREGGRVTQLVVEGDLRAVVKGLQRESVLSVKGYRHGERDFIASEIEVLSSAETPPFTLVDKTDGGHDLRSEYRYLDIRRKEVSDRLRFKSNMSHYIRGVLHSGGCVEVETPLLVSATEGGAGEVSASVGDVPYKLAQSPQLFKQLLMVGGIGKYFQFAKCFRAEDYRKDRQVEFTQLDCEFSFVTQEQVMERCEVMLSAVLKRMQIKRVANIERLTWAESMDKYGTDKPDLRSRKGEIAIAWVYDFPLFDKQDGRLVSMHHPFTQPKDGVLTEDALSQSYDLVINGVEVGGGSIRINNADLQRRVFDMLGYSEDSFGWFVRALEYGTPPHGGFALGIDRLCAVLNGGDIQDYIAFPKNSAWKCMMQK